MGHYDSCREADEQLEMKRRGLVMKTWVARLTDEDAGQLRAYLDGIFAMQNSFIGNHEQTERFAKLVDQARKTLGI